jgi:hypothetical protein
MFYAALLQTYSQTGVETGLARDVRPYYIPLSTLVQHTASTCETQCDVKSSIHKFRRKDKYAERRCRCVSPVVTFSGKVKQTSEGGPDKGCTEDLLIKDASEEVMACDTVMGCVLRSEAH